MRAEALQIEDGAILSSLSDDAINTVAIGLERSFGCTLQPRNGRLWLADVHSGSAFMLKPGATVQSVWEVAEIIDRARP